VKIRELFKRTDRRVFSFEFFPPKTDAGMATLERTIRELGELSPSFVSVTYGAGGSTRERTVDIVSRIQRETGICAMAHLTCVGSNKNEIGGVLDRLVGHGIENIMALRGDPPEGQTAFQRPADGFGYASDLIAFIRHRFGDKLSVGGAAYPETHVESRDMDLDLAHLRTKVDAGADFIVTQLFFDNIFYFDFVKRARAAGITVPIVPGIMPIRNVAQIERFTKLCGATIPAALFNELDRRRDDAEAVAQLGVAHATAQCVELLHGGAPGIHFYTLNQSPASRVILTALKAVRLA
jgi:methylenetetrahydrofolate reductase (NADPH)